MLVKVWSIQTLSAWQCLQETGVLRAKVAYVEPTWLHAYEWMARQLAQRVGPAPSGCDLPIWVWCQWNGRRHAKPDLRYKAHLPSGTPGVRLTLSLDTARLLCSDFHLWHYPLNQAYLPETLAEWAWFDACEEAHGFPNHWFDQHDLERSWERVFDLDWDNPDFTYARLEKSIQAVLWELHLNDVIVAEHFCAR
jgi:hypothetical protein